MQYPALFKQDTRTNTVQSADSVVPTAPDFLPMGKQEEYRSTIIDKALSEILNEDGLLRLKAMEYAIELLGGRTFSSTDVIDGLFDKIYTKIKNGTTPTKNRSQVH